MGIDLKRGESIFIDTAPLIYFWEKHAGYYAKMLSLFNSIYERDIQCTVSLVTYIEVVTLPLKMKKSKIAARYREYLTNSQNFQLYPVNLLVADKTALLRAKYDLKTPDAIQLATAEICGADYVLTNDRAWNRVTGLTIVQIDDL